MKSTNNIYIIGAGVSGLIAAIELEKAGYAPVILEKTNSVGGRVKSDAVNEAMFDHGFQVLLTQYPAASAYLDYPLLQLQNFVPGALVFKNGKKYTIGDPLRDRSFFWSSFIGSVGTLSDKLKALQLSNQVKKRSLNSIFEEPDKSTLDYLQDYGFSNQIIENFFRPFYTGIFLEGQLATSCRMFLFVFKMFAEGNAAIPAKGMQAIPDQLSQQLKHTTIRFNSEVTSIEQNKISLKDGQSIDADLILIATEAKAFLGESKAPAPSWHTCTSLYFKTSSESFGQAIIGLIADPMALINNVYFLNDLAHHRGEDKICCVTVVKKHDLDEKDLIEKVRAELNQYCHIQASDCLKTYTINKALPQLNDLKYRPNDQQIQFTDTIFLAGDHLANGSLNAAMESGKRAAELMIVHMEKT